MLTIVGNSLLFWHISILRPTQPGVRFRQRSRDGRLCTMKMPPTETCGGSSTLGQWDGRGGNSTHGQWDGKGGNSTHGQWDGRGRRGTDNWESGKERVIWDGWRGGSEGGLIVGDGWKRKPSWTVGRAISFGRCLCINLNAFWGLLSPDTSLKVKLH